MAHEKNCRPFPIEPAPYAPGGECHPCRPDPCCPPRPPRPTPPPPPGCGPSQYVGARYVPKFADPIEWDIERGYESLTIVTYKGESYTSKCPVPPGIDIKNTRYWALTGAYNAQVEEYKNQVKDLSQQVTEFASDNKEFRDKITQYDKDNAEMKNTVASTVARVDALAERVDNADAAISDLQAGQAQTVKDIAALEAKDADLQRQITSNDTDISALQAKDREQDARLDAIETVNDSQAATISQNTQDIARNTKNIQDNAANIAVNSKELAKHAAQLKDHDAQLTVLHKEVTDNHTAIERLTSVTDGLRADLTEDEAKIAQSPTMSSCRFWSAANSCLVTWSALAVSRAAILPSCSVSLASRRAMVFAYSFGSMSSRCSTLSSTAAMAVSRAASLALRSAMSCVWPSVLVSRAVIRRSWSDSSSACFASS
jgi:myosin heavy subunit